MKQLIEDDCLNGQAMGNVLHDTSGEEYYAVLL
jgi:hypothetical protein